MSKQSFNFTIEPWSVLHENKEYETPIFNLLQRKMQLEAMDEKNVGDFFVLQAPEWVNVIPITTAGNVILVEQYRYGTEQPTLETPGGMVDQGEEPLEAIRRELAEETGYYSDSWESLGKVSANPAIMDNFSHLFLARDCSFNGIEETKDDIHERIKVHELALKDFLDLIEDGTIHHTIVLAAVARYLLQKNGNNNANH